MIQVHLCTCSNKLCFWMCTTSSKTHEPHPVMRGGDYWSIESGAFSRNVDIGRDLNATQMRTRVTGAVKLENDFSHATTGANENAVGSRRGDRYCLSGGPRKPLENVGRDNGWKGSSNYVVAGVYVAVRYSKSVPVVSSCRDRPTRRARKPFFGDLIRGRRATPGRVAPDRTTRPIGAKIDY